MSNQNICPHCKEKDTLELSIRNTMYYCGNCGEHIYR